MTTITSSSLLIQKCLLLRVDGVLSGHLLSARYSANFSLNRLSVSNIINLNSQQYADEYARYLKFDQYNTLKQLKAPTIISHEEECEVREHFKDAKEAIFDKNEGVQYSVSEGAKQQIAYICAMMKNKCNEWQPFLSSDYEDESEGEDEDDAEDSTKKRKREADLDESDVVQVVKELLNAVFGDTFLRWRSGERTTAATKRMKKINECTNNPTATTIKNLMGRRSDLVAYNEKKVPVCISEVKDGKNSCSSTAQESKSILCSKSLQVYNALAGGSDHIWSLDWNSTEGYIYHLKKFDDVDVMLPGRKLKLPVRVEEIEELKTFLKDYSSKLSDEFTAAEKTTQVYHSPK